MKTINENPGILKRMVHYMLSFKLSTKVIFIFMGLASTIWFLIRVIPKPQRAAYPCMRTAAPIMSGFIIYILSLGGSVLIFRKALSKFKQARYWSAAVAVLMSVVLLAVFNITDVRTIYANVFGANWTRGVLPDGSNNPMGTAVGIYPGRVIWVWDKNATNENCTNVIVLKTISGSGWNAVKVMDWDKSDAFIMPKNNNQTVIETMANNSVKRLTGESTVKASWDALFNNFNLRKNGTASGYTAGQTIFIKVNNGQAGWAINSSDLSEKGNTSATGVVDAAMSNTTPATVLAYVRQLVDTCGIPQENIYVAEPMTHVFKSLYDLIHASYPNVKVLDKENKTALGRTTSAGWQADVIKFSDKGTVMPSAVKDDLMKEMYNADYLINIAALKAHARAGVTMCAKLHFGSSTHGGTYGADPLHAGLISTQGNDAMTSGVRGDYKMYRVLTDLMGHKKLGGNTVLFVLDALWSGIEATDMPVKWKIAPFNNDFPNSLLVGQDEVAVESVGLDFLRAEADKNTAFKDRPYFPAVDDFLHQAADSNNWPTGIKYDPEGDGITIKSLGIHEHWNNPVKKQYSRNLSIDGKGIELVLVGDTTSPPAIPATPGAISGITSQSPSLTNQIYSIRMVSNATNYTWTVPTGWTITAGQGTFSITVTTGTAGQDGNISVTAGNISGTSAASTLPVTIISVKVKNNGLASKVSIFPNPFVSSVQIQYTLDNSSKVSVMVYNNAGQNLALLQNGIQNAGPHSLAWTPAKTMASGNYFIRFSMNNQVQNIKIAYIK
jgi:hypothetical protein